MKRLFAGGIIFISIMITMFFPMSVSAASEGDYEYIVEDGMAVLTEYTGDDIKVTVPAEIGGYKVAATDGTFSYNDEVKMVILPEGLTTIGAWTFMGCEDLEEITIPDTVTTIGDSAFLGTGISGITLPDSVETVENYCFAYCEELLCADIGKARLEFGHNAFKGTDIEFIRAEYTPVYYDDTFSDECLFSDKSMNSLIWEHMLKSESVWKANDYHLLFPRYLNYLITYMEILIAVVVLSPIYFIRRNLRIKAGKDKESNYKKYSEDCMKSLCSNSSGITTIYYRRPIILRDTIKRYVYIVLGAVVVIAHGALGWYIFEELGLETEGIFRNLITYVIMLFVLTLLFIVILAIVVLLIVKLISAIRVLPGKPRPRIIKMNRGENIND